ncbi:nucleotidyltransferase substrate binding protein [bacterium]|nr:nucleotidyltransferase substrate binding protein [bacterium]
MKKNELDLSSLKNSYNTLSECYKDYIAEKNDKIKTYIKDSCIKRFEYTYETAKKIMNKYLKKEYDKDEKELTINNIFRDMYGLGFIKDFERWTEYRLKRNTTSHEYDIEKTYVLMDIIPNFIKDTEFLINELEKTLED